jgi:hypothetical protein
LQASGFRLQASGFRLQASGFRLQASGFRLQRGIYYLRHFELLILPKKAANTIEEVTVRKSPFERGFRGVFAQAKNVYSSQ